MKLYRIKSAEERYHEAVEEAYDYLQTNDNFKKEVRLHQLKMSLAVEDPHYRIHGDEWVIESEKDFQTYLDDEWRLDLAIRCELAYAQKNRLAEGEWLTQDPNLASILATSFLSAIDEDTEEELVECVKKALMAYHYERIENSLKLYANAAANDRSVEGSTL